MKSRRKLKQRIPFDLAPLVDLLFMLLMFFMIGYSEKQPQEMEVNLPTSAYSQTKKEEAGLSFFLKEDGKLFLNKEEVSPEQLEGKLLGIDREKNVDLHADANTSYQDIVNLMAELGKLGFKKLQLETQKSN